MLVAATCAGAGRNWQLLVRPTSALQVVATTPRHVLQLRCLAGHLCFARRVCRLQYSSIRRGSLQTSRTCVLDGSAGSAV